MGSDERSAGGQLWTRTRLGRSRTVSVAALCAVAVAGCSSTVPVETAPHADALECAEVMAALYQTDELAQQQRHEVTAQSAAAWGDPAIILRCGVEEPGPSTEGCVQVNGVDWLGPRDPLNNDRRYISYGRSPAVEVFVPTGQDAPIEVVLTSLNSVVEDLPQTRQCT